MRILFVTTGTIAPSARFRVQQFLPHFRARGLVCDVVAAYGDGYRVWNRGRLGLVYKSVQRLKRALRTVAAAGAYDLVFLQRTALRYSALPERIASWRNPAVVFDFDDAIFLDPPHGMENPRLRGAFDETVSASCHVIAGNEYLAREAGAPDKTTIIPTVIDTDLYRPAVDGPETDGPTVMGWMGTSSNFPALALVLPALQRLLGERADLRLRIVADRPYPGLESQERIEQIPWSEKTEIDLLRSFDIGLMPLEDNAWSRGKCGFKMIQYMAVGVPAVASAVGANPSLVGASGGALLLEDGADWLPSLRQLLDDPARRMRMGRSGRRHVERTLSVKAVRDRYLQIFRATAADRKERAG